MHRLAALFSALLLASVSPCQTVLQRETIPHEVVLQQEAIPNEAVLQPKAVATPPQETIVPGRFVVVYRNGVIPADADAAVATAGAHIVSRMDRFGMASIANNGTDDAAVRASLAAQPNVLAVLRDRYVQAHALIFAAVPSILPAAPARVAISPTQTAVLPTRTAALPTNTVALPRPAANVAPPIGPQLTPVNVPISESVSNPVDAYYNSPQGWAVQQSGGFGDNIPGGAAIGPWNVSKGAGVRIAILDSGIDAANPSVAPNLALNLSEVDQSAQTGLPSPCDDGSPQDQQGHGTWTASLAAAAIDAGQVIGVAPQATLLNIKVLERMPAAATSATETTASECEAGQAGGLLSWVLQGINDAVAQHANVISLSLGTLVDITTGDGAGWQASFDQATYAAAQAGVVIVAAVGNDGLNLSTGNDIELPAQARGVLPVIASTNPACAENLAPNATCVPGPVALASYSNFGSTLNAIAAPGGNQPEGPDTGVSGFVRGACSSGLPNTTDGLPADGQSFGCFGFGHAQYVQAMGTSASAPLVAGAAALLHAANPGWTAPQIIAALLASATTSTAPAPQLNLPAALALQ